MNNLKDVHRKHCPLGVTIEKDSRSYFVKGQPKEIIDNFQILMKYCANDVLATYEVFTELFPTFLVRYVFSIIKYDFKKYLSCQKSNIFLSLVDSKQDFLD